MIHLFAGLICVLLDSVVFDLSYSISGAASFGTQFMRRLGLIYKKARVHPFLAPSWRWGWRGEIVAKIGVLSAWRLVL